MKVNKKDLIEKISETIKKLKKKPFFVSESFLIDDWHALEELIVFEPTLCPLLKRKIHGFEASGGKVSLVS